VRERAGTVVIGAGFLGASIAAELAARGDDVMVLGREQDGVAASTRSLGWLNAGSVADSAYHRLRREGLARHRALAATLPDDGTYVFAGSLSWHVGGALEPVQGESRAHDLTIAHDQRRAFGEDVRLLTADEARTIEPAVSRSATGPFLFAPGDAVVDLRGLTAHVLDRARSAGVRTAMLTAPARLAGDVDAPEIVLPDGNRLRPARVVVAAGADTPALAASIGVDIPHVSTIGAIVVTSPVAVPPRALLRSAGASVRATADGALLLGGRAVDDAVASAIPHAAGEVDRRVTPEVDDAVGVLVAASEAMIDPAGPLRIRRVLAGRRPVPGDGHPVVGRVGARTWLAFSHSGATLGPLLGALLADDLSADGEVGGFLDPYRPTRFATA
jgi:glycine/D-amino acid oxidase-like deaminating enzyme